MKERFRIYWLGNLEPVSNLPKYYVVVEIYSTHLIIHL